MGVINSMQVYLEDTVSEVEIASFLGEILGFAVDSADFEVHGSLGFVQIMEYTQGFRQGVLITWPNSIQASSPEVVIIELARKFCTYVLLEPDDQGVEWLLASPEGSLKKAAIEILDDGIGTATMTCPH